MTVDSIVKAKLKNGAITKEDRALAIAEIEQVIMDYCRVDAVPDTLTYTWANMAADLLRYQYAAQSGEVERGAVSSITEGDTSVHFGGETAHKARLDDIAMNYRAQMQRHRRMDWGRAH